MTESSPATFWQWRDEIRRRGFAILTNPTNPWRADHDAILAEQSAVNAVALRWNPVAP